MHEIAWSIIIASSVISAIILSAEEIKVLQALILTDFYKLGRIQLCSTENSQQKNIANFVFVVCDPGAMLGPWTMLGQQLSVGTDFQEVLALISVKMWLSEGPVEVLQQFSESWDSYSLNFYSVLPVFEQSIVHSASSLVMYCWFLNSCCISWGSFSLYYNMKKHKSLQSANKSE